MRPSELDHTSRAKHYFDVTNGEILVGAQQRREYFQRGANPSDVVDLGPLLRTPREESRTWEYDPLSTKRWDREQFIQYGKWLNFVVGPPPEGRKRLTREVITNAGRLGLGPGVQGVRTRFGSPSSFFAEIRVMDSRRAGLFDGWSRGDFAKHLQTALGGRRPKREDIDRLAERNPWLPTSTIYDRRFSDQGSFGGALRLAGFWASRNATEDDYYEWGLNYMAANDGTLPVRSACDYLSLKKLGPSATIVHRNIGSMTIFQQELHERYAEQQAEKMRERAKMLEEIEIDRRRGWVPEELFQFEDSGEPLRSEERRRRDEEVLMRYGKYRVLQLLVPHMTDERRIEIAEGADGHEFIVAVRQSNNIPASEIEHAALVVGYYDEIWPPNGHQHLRLDEGYADFVQERGTKSYQKSKERLKAAA